jgi:purine-nucleoside phosphorylase
MIRIAALMIGISALVASTALAQPTTINVLGEYADHPGRERLNTPSDEIQWLKRNQLTHGELDDFPEVAIVLYRVDVERYLNELGFGGYYKSFSYGFTDPVLVFVVRKPGMTPFAVARGLPGAGGITTEAAELHAMGINTIIHVGTAGLLSPGIPYGQLVVSDGSYKDGAAFLLDNESKEQISRPDQSLTEKIVETVDKDNIEHIRAIGFTIPIYYFQPGSMLRALLGVTGPDKPMFIEMEEASLFALARLAGFRAASIVVASDRLESHDGKLSQEFWDGDLDQLERLAFQEAINTIAGRIQH